MCKGKCVIVEPLGATTQGVCKYKPWQFVKGLRHIFAGMKRFAATLIAAQMALGLCAMGTGALMAQNVDVGHAGARTVETVSWVEEWDPMQGRWVKVADDEAGFDVETLPTVVTTIVEGRAVSETRSAARYAQPVPAPSPQMALAQYGPFLVVSPDVARMVGSTNGHSPQHFDAMLRDFPGIKTLEMVEAPGTSNDIANLTVGRKIREAEISTHVPRGGSVRSGAVELFLAGQTRSIDEGATFAVHSWLDNHGREADDFAADHPAHRLYLDYYVEMGMSAGQAREFYAMTNSVPHASARWLKADEMRGWIAPELKSPQRYAARHLAQNAHSNAPPNAPPRAGLGMVEAVCAFCERVSDNLAMTNAHIASMTFPPIAVNMARPLIDYGDVAEMKIAWGHTSLLDS